VINQRQLVVVANRLPVRRIPDDDGERGERWATSPGGLVSALTPVMADRSNAMWIGWAGSAGAAPTPFDHDGIRLHPIELSRADLQLFYEGFSNATIWPLYHDGIAQPEYHRTWWDAYVKVNQRYADAVIEHSDPNASVWIHDYQLQLVPKMIRQRRDDLNIGFFNHIPFPARELFLRLPWRTQIIEGLLGADLIGFQTDVMTHNFLRAAARVLADDRISVDDDGGSIEIVNRTVAVQTRPIGIDYDHVVEVTGTVDTAVADLRETLNHPRSVIVGVDRLDYTKGIARRLRAFAELLDEDRLDAEHTVFIQIAEPSRTNVIGYGEIRQEVEQLVGEINGVYATMTRPAVHYIHRTHSFEEVVALYRLADVMLVTPFRDGMNLVAKEYVAARSDEAGALVLSEFAGAIHELSDAVHVNPFDIEGLKNAIERAVRMPRAEQRERMRAMRASVASNTSHDWATSFLSELERE
jgi:trehalose 6-phosphate synthase